MSTEPAAPEYDARRLRELFAAACELDEDQRETFLDRSCYGAPVLRAAVERLLRADGDAGNQTLWRSPAAAVEARHMAADASLPFDRLGDYHILSRLGAGGMGAVYLAERDYDGVSRRVAIKVIPRSLADDETLQRFLQERRILGRLEHPHIARMLDAGRTPDGLPYLAMEYVDGVPLDQYADSRRLGVKERVALFGVICDAVTYAHRNLIVHRDLKPRNILVDAEGNLKLLDFGIAKLLGEAGDADVTGAMLMTTRYASPEQLAGAPVTTASDVYSLGVILRELLAGEKRSVDLENVLAMALREQPERRYASPSDFAEDARRAVEGYPVRARPDTLAYRLRRLVARRRWESAAAAAVAAALITAGAVTWKEYRAAERRFNEVRSVANSFLFEVYDAIADSPGTTQARSLLAQRAQQYLDALARDHSGDVALRRELAAAYRRLADIQGQPFTANLGDTAAALSNYRKAGALLEEIAAGGRAGNALLTDRGEIAALECQVAIRHGAPEDAAALCRKSLDFFERARVLEPLSREARFQKVSAMVTLSFAERHAADAAGDLNRNREAVALAAEALTEARALHAGDPGDDRFTLLAAHAAHRVFGAYVPLSNWVDRTENLLRSAQAAEEELALTQVLNARNPNRYRRDLLMALQDASRGWRFRGDLEQAEATGREAVRLARELAAADPHNLEATRDLYAVRYAFAEVLRARRPREAADELERVIADYDRLHRQNLLDRGVDGIVADSVRRLTVLRLAAGERGAAIALCRRSIAMLSGSADADDRRRLAEAYSVMGDALAPSDHEQARGYYGQAVALWDQLRDSHQLRAVDASTANQARLALAH